ncbi:hypothetical protein WJ62_05130 [Burkholderia diffusa]|nr:hypothetical protein WJ62_05130 [Burkholderia diffusa]
MAIAHGSAVFLAALRNSQPMGFYTPSQLVQDARRRGVQMLPVDVNVSTWDGSCDRRPDHIGAGAAWFLAAARHA